MLGHTAPLSARESGRLRQAGGGVMTQRTRKVNPLLSKDDIGQAKPSAYDLPHEHFAYGRPGNHDREGAREVSMCWMSHRPTPAPDAAIPDFVSLHKRAAAAKITTPRDLRHYRQEREELEGAQRSQSARRSSPRGAHGSRDVIPSDVIPGFTYGRKVRPSTPIQHVISYRWAEKSEQELQRFYTEFREGQEAAETQVRRIPLTTASRGHASTAKRALYHREETKELFKIDKFKHLTTKIKNGRRRAGDAVDLDPGCSASCDDDDNGCSRTMGSARLYPPAAAGGYDAGLGFGGGNEQLGEYA